MLLDISIHMEFAIYSFLFLILFLGVLFNLKITNSKRVNESKFLNERGEYGANTHKVDTDQFNKYMRNKDDEIKKLGPEAYRLAHFFQSKLSRPITSLKAGFDNGGNKLQQLFDDAGREMTDKVLYIISTAFEYAALQPGYEDDDGTPLKAKPSHKRGVNPFDSIK